MTEAGRNAALAALLSAAAGALLGAFGAGWQAIVEPGQVLADLVRYPAENLRFQYLMKIPVAQHYLAAWLLDAGLDERAVSVVFSALLTAAQFQAWALLVMALAGRDRLALAVGAPLLIFATLAGLRGLNYPIILPPADYGYGGFTITLATLVVAWFAMGWWRAAALLAGLLPATHPVVGLWAAGLVGLALLLAWRRGEVRLAGAPVWYAAGLLASVAVAAAHFAAVGLASPELGVTHRQAILDYSRLHDGHRAPVRPSLTLVQVAAALVLTAAATIGLWRRAPAGLRLALTILATNGVFGVLATTVYDWPDQLIPVSLFAAMPNRFLNINAALFAALALGLAAGHPRGRPVLVALLAGLCLTTALGYGHAQRGAAATLGLVLATPVLALLALGRIEGLAAMGAAALQRVPRLGVVAGTWLWLAAAVAATGAVALDLHRGRDQRLLYFGNDAALAAAQARPGLLLFTGDYAKPQFWGQIQTRRAVLFDPLTVTALPYLGEQAAAQTALLRDVWGIDLYARDPACNYVSSPCVRRQWEGRTRADWTALAARHGFTDILVPADWTLNLPLVAASAEFRLFAVF